MSKPWLYALIGLFVGGSEADGGASAFVAALIGWFVGKHFEEKERRRS